MNNEIKLNTLLGPTTLKVEPEQYDQAGVNLRFVGERAVNFYRFTPEEAEDLARLLMQGAAASRQAFAKKG